MQTKLILNEIYDIKPKYIFDNRICKYNKNVMSITEVDELDLNNVNIIFTMALDHKLYNELLKQIVSKNLNVIEIIGYINTPEELSNCKVGKYSYGDIIKGYSRMYCESIGAFCSLAEGTRVVENHASQYISTSPFIYYDKRINDYLGKTYEEYSEEQWYFDGVKPKGIINKATKSKIGNDVWLGRNVTITNGANIGNGVIAGAGAVITKDVPDYAIVVGVPAKIVRYRYTPKQIDALNRICWWNWTDEQIKERYEDFFLPIDEFIEKYDN